MTFQYVVLLSVYNCLSSCSSDDARLTTGYEFTQIYFAACIFHRLIVTALEDNYFFPVLRIE